MRKGSSNIGYYLSEVVTIFKLGKLSVFLSFISLAMIFFIALLTVSGWLISQNLSDALKDEAEISAYMRPDLNAYSKAALMAEIKEILGVISVTEVTAETAYEQMSEVLGQEASILSQFEENPFEAYIAIGIDLDQRKEVLERLSAFEQIEYIRDNQSVLEKIDRITKIIGLIGLLATIAVVVATFIVTSHIIREGVHMHKDQINTLKLLGAPDAFIQTPFIMEGILLTLLASTLSLSAFMLFSIQITRGMSDLLNFLPQLDRQSMMLTIGSGTIIIAILLGFVASVFGLKMVKERR